VYAHLPLPSNAASGSVVDQTRDLFALWAAAGVSFVRTFHMPLFFAISGFRYAYTNPPGRRRRSYAHLVRDKAARLLLPYVAISSLAFPVKCLFSEFALRPVSAGFFQSYVEGLLWPAHNPIAFFWFLPTLFFIFLVAPGLLPCLRPAGKGYARALTVLVTAVLVWLHFMCFSFAPPGPSPLNYVDAIRYLVFFWLGMWTCRLWGERMTGHKELDGGEPPFPRVGMFLLAAVVLTVDVALFATYPGSPAARLVMGCLGAAAAFLIASGLAGYKIRLLNTIGLYSYQIYLLSWFFQTPVQIAYFHFLPGAPSAIMCLVSFVAAIAGPIIIACLVLAYTPKIKSLIGL
jgi:peptidoglycan/LPS O-acetylase OafA/YrhL